MSMGTKSHAPGYITFSNPDNQGIKEYSKYSVIGISKHSVLLGDQLN